MFDPFQSSKSNVYRNVRPAEDMFLFVNPGSGGNKGKARPVPFGSDATSMSACLIWSGQILATSAEVTPKGSLVRESYPTWP